MHYTFFFQGVLASACRALYSAAFLKIEVYIYIYMYFLVLHAFGLETGSWDISTMGAGVRLGFIHISACLGCRIADCDGSGAAWGDLFVLFCFVFELRAGDCLCGFFGCR